MKQTKDYTLVAIAVSNIIGCNCPGEPEDAIAGKNKHQDGGVISADGGSAGRSHSHSTIELIIRVMTVAMQ